MIRMAPKDWHRRSGIMNRYAIAGIICLLTTAGAHALDPAIIKMYDPNNRVSSTASGVTPVSGSSCSSCQNQTFGVKKLFPKPWGGYVNDGQVHGCYANHNDFGCGSFTSDAVFIFGSCRAFFGRSCNKRPGPTPWELLYGPHMATAPNVLPPGVYSPSRPSPTPSVEID